MEKALHHMMGYRLRLTRISGTNVEEVTSEVSDDSESSERSESSDEEIETRNTIPNHKPSIIWKEHYLRPGISLLNFLSTLSNYLSLEKLRKSIIFSFAKLLLLD